MDAAMGKRRCMSADPVGGLQNTARAVTISNERIFIENNIPKQPPLHKTAAVT